MASTRFIMLLIAFIGLGTLLEIYTYRGLRSRWDNWRKWQRVSARSLYFFFLGLGILSMLMMFILGNYFSRATLNFWFSFTVWNWSIKLFLSVFLLIDDLRRFTIFGKRKILSQKKGEKISRSDFLVKTGAVAATIPFLGLGWGMLAGPYRYRVYSERIKLPHLPKAFDGLKIVQISDIHSGSFYDKEAVQKGIDLVNAQNADVIFFTGDIVNDKAEELEPYLEMFAQITAPMGVYSILGNHDYGDYTSWDSEEAKEENNRNIRAAHGKMGWKLLLNEHVYLEKSGEKIGLIGCENWGKGFHKEGDLEKAAKGCEAPVKLLLSHDPTHFDEIVKKDFKDIDIMFAGHTHGAQIGIETGGFKWSPISLRYSKWAGLYKEEEQYLYINRGFGFIGYAGRLGIMPEVTVMTLEA
ncbi:MAG: metallophosphoesterase [Crocinitomicaceae bacterium]|nr:metallophosphoesterase [Crocinitomicaceae bacterium]